MLGGTEGFLETWGTVFANGKQPFGETISPL